MLQPPKSAGATSQLVSWKLSVQLQMPALQVPWPLQSLSPRQGSGHVWPLEPPEMQEVLRVGLEPDVNRLQTRSTVWYVKFVQDGNSSQ